MKKLFLMCAMFFVVLAGCGSGGGNSGSLALSAPVVDSTNSIVSTTATYTPASGKTLISGPEVSFTWWTVGETSQTKSPEVPVNGNLNNGGSATSQLTLPLGRIENLNVFVTAQIGGVKSDIKSIKVSP